MRNELTQTAEELQKNALEAAEGMQELILFPAMISPFTIWCLDTAVLLGI